MNNTNLHHAIHGTLKLAGEVGGLRETFFVNQAMHNHRVDLAKSGDFLVDEQYVVEVGGKGKEEKQIQGIENAYLALDNIEVGFGKRVPLYMFGFLY